eukprot:6491060-Amphidinium_carterae.1
MAPKKIGKKKEVKPLLGTAAPKMGKRKLVQLLPGTTSKDPPKGDKCLCGLCGKSPQDTCIGEVSLNGFVSSIARSREENIVRVLAFQ